MEHTEPKQSLLPFWQLLKVNLLQTVRRVTHAGSKSGTLSAIVALFLVLYPLIAAGMFWAGLRYVSKFPGLGDMLIERLVFLLFAFLFVMLLFSNIVVGYTNMFRNGETRFLQTLPISSDNIFRWKLVETTVVASWAFLMLVAPLLVAFGIHQKADASFYWITPFLVAMFIMLPSVLGCWVAVFIARYMDRSLFQITAVLLLVGLLYMVGIHLQPDAATEQTLETRVMDLLDRMMSKTDFAQMPFLPSYWVSSTVNHWVDGARNLSWFFIQLLLANVMFFGFLSFTETGRYFYRSLSTTLSRGSLAGDWSQLVTFTPRLCAQVIVLAWFLPLINFAPVHNYWKQQFAPVSEQYAAMKKDEDVNTVSLGMWLTNEVSALEPRIAQGGLYPLKPELRRIYERNLSGEIQQLGPDLDFLIQANLRGSVTGLDLTHGRTILQNRAAAFAAEQEATLMPDAPIDRLVFLEPTSDLELEGNTVRFTTGARDLQPGATYRIHLRHRVSLVDDNEMPTGETIWAPDPGNYLTGTLSAEGSRYRLTLGPPTGEENPVPIGVQGLDTVLWWQDQTTDTPPDPETEPSPEPSWILARTIEAPHAVAPTETASLPANGMLAIPLLALFAWVWNTRTAHCIAAGGIVLTLVYLIVQLNPVVSGISLEQSLGISGFIGMGAWIILVVALIQGASVLWQERLEARYQVWYRARLERQKEFHYQAGPLESVLSRIPFVSGDILAVLLKDLRVFWRDTAQWGQSLFLFIILLIYILNLRFFTEQFTTLFGGGRFGGDYFLKLVSFMNLAACSLNLATLTTRFVYPQFSLEGKRLWIVGLSPLGLGRVVQVKFLLATCISLLISFPLIWLSSEMLQLPTIQKLFFCAAISVMAFALNGLAVGMGVLYPNLKEDNPSKIVSGFGGTFCLVISFVYIGMAVMMLGIGSPFGSPWQFMGRADESRQLIYLSMFLIFSLMVGLGPLYYGLHRARRFEH